MPGKKHTLFTLLNILVILVISLTACSQVPSASSSAAADLPTDTPPPLVAQTPTSSALSKSVLTPTATATLPPVFNAFGAALPPDAAPPSQQYLRLLNGEGITTDFAVSASKRCSAQCDILSTPLVRVDKNFDLIPAGALSWDVSKDGRTWTFHLDPALKWSDGNPVTADDVVATFQYQANPKHAWDFAWFWNDIDHWSDAVAGRVPVTQIGVKKVDAATVQFITTAPSPYFLSKALYIRPLSKVAFDKYGEFYDNDPKTSVSSSPWVLEEWTKDKQIVFGPNKKYTGKLKPYLEKLIIVFGDPATEFQAYQNNEVDFAQNFTPPDLKLIVTDPQLSSEYHSDFGNFQTYYLGFNSLVRPFNDIRVRQAFAKAIDRDAILKNVIGRQGTAAYSLLMPGFPDSTSSQLKKEDVNKFDPGAAQKLLAEAGFPGGKNFPYLQLWLRQESPMNQSVAVAITTMLKQNLSINVQIVNADSNTFAYNFNQHRLSFYMMSAGFDYLDPSSMLGSWVSGGSNAWKNDQFDQLVKDAATLIGNQPKRDKEYKDAEKILVDDAAAVFLYHTSSGSIYKPYIKGSELEPDKNNVAAWHWPGLEDMGMLMSTIYISNDVTHYRK